MSNIRNEVSTNSPPSASKSLEAESLTAALRGDSQGFAELTEPYRHELQVHCYRILGSTHEAEDMVQETMLKAWRRLGTYESRASFRSWLYKIATNTCLDFLDKQRGRRLLPMEVLSPSNQGIPITPPSPEMTWLEPFPDKWLEEKTSVNPESLYTETENISLSFLTALQILPPRQRAVLILCDVLDFSARETAEVLEITVSAVNSALHRARETLAKKYHGQENEGEKHSITDERKQWLLDHFVQAWESANVDELVALLKEDATFAMPPSSSWYQGGAAIRAFVAATVFADGGMFAGKADHRWRLVLTHANNSPAYAIYQRDEKNEYQSFGIHVLEFSEEHLKEIISFIDPSLPVRFGLPKTLGKE